MITGFNTDVKHKTKVYHVQTEDKGRNNPKIETLVYMGGEILDSYRTSYDMARDSLQEDEIIQMMESQHKRVINAIKIGKYDEDDDFSREATGSLDLDEMIKNYLESEQPMDPLKLYIQGKPHFESGKTVDVQLVTREANSQKPIVGAYIKIKLISLHQKPQLLAQGETLEEGRFSVSVTLPMVDQAGDFSVIIQALSDHGTAEYKYDL